MVPEDYSYIEKDGEAMNYPPKMVKFLYHDLGDENKNYATVILSEWVCNQDGKNSRKVEREVRIPDDVATDIVYLFSGETKLRITDDMLGMYQEVKEP